MQESRINLALLWPKHSGNVTSVNELVIGMDKKRFNVIFIYLNSPDADDIIRKQSDIYFLSSKKKTGQFNPFILRRLVRILRDNKIDILHCHRHKQVIYGAMASCFSPNPVILAHVHGLNRTRNLCRRIVNFLAFRKVNKLIAVSRTTGVDVLKTNWKLPTKKLCVLENSVDYERFADVTVSRRNAKQMLQVPENAFVFGTIGRLAPTKGLTYLLEAFSKVKAQISSAHLIFLGDGLLKPELEKQVSKMQCEDSIHFLGYRTDIEALLKGFDVFVLSSIAEGMPRAILEAMAAAVPCVATKVGGIAEIINDGDVGFLVSPGDSNALARAMLKVANMPKNKLDSLADRARKRVLTAYSHRVVREKLRQLYESEFEACANKSG